MELRALTGRFPFPDLVDGPASDLAYVILDPAITALDPSRASATRDLNTPRSR